MDDIHINLDELKLDETILKDVKYYISGQVPEKVLDVLRQCGAECSNYFTDYVTHLICGSEPDEDDITDASDVYEIPIVTPRWVMTCARLRKRMSPNGFFYDPNQLFSGLVFCFSQVRGEDRHALWSLCTYFGGVVHHNLSAHCTHLVTYDVKTSKYLKAFSLNDRIRIVTPDWVMESVKNKSLAGAEFFHPKLLLWPKPSESTALITGFADDTEKVVDIPETESTQALLDKLKQRMPWNQPNTPTNAPANFPNFVNPTQEPAKRPQWTPPQSQPTTPQTTTNQSPFNSPEIKPRVQWTSGQTPNTQYPDTQLSQTIKQEPDTNPAIQSQQKLQQPQQTQQQQLPTNQQQLPTNPQQQLPTNQQQQLPTNQQQQLATNQQQQLATNQQVPANQQLPTNQQSQQIFQRIQRVQQFQNQQQTQQFNQLPQQNSQPQQIQNRTFMSPPTSQQPHLVTNQPQQYKLQNQQIGQPQVHHLPQTAGNQPKIGLITTQQQPNIQTGQLIQNRLNQFGNQQFPQQQQQQNQQQFTPRVQVKQEKLPFNNQNMTQQYTVQNPQQQQNIVHQFMQTVQQRPQLHQNWQTQQLNQQQQPPQLNTQTINQQQLNQTQLNQQINQLQQGQINPQLNPQQIQQQINIQLNQTQQRIIQQQLNQQQINTQQINQQSLNNQQQLQQRLNQQIESQLNQQQQQPNQIQHQRLSQQLESQLNTQVNQAQLQQQRLTQQLESQLNSQQVSQQQQQQQRLSQQLEIPQQVNQTQILQQQQQQHQQQQQQLELNPQQIRLNQQIEQQLNTPQLNQQQINQVQLNPQQQQQINQVQLNQQLQQPQQINQQQQQIPQQQAIQLTPQQLQQRQLAQQQLNQTHLVQQQQLLQQQQQIQRPIGAPRLNWSPNQQPQRQLIHLDAQTHQQLQQMDPQQRALFVAKLQKQRQILLQQRQNHLLQQQQQQRGGQISVVRGGMPPGLTPQQQIQLLQQQQQQTITKQQTIVMPQHAGGAPGLSPILTDQQSHQQMQIQRQQFQRLQQLHLQREQAQKQQLQQQVPTVAIVRPSLPTQEAATVAVAVPGAVGEPVIPATPQQQLVVNAKTKTALANMLSIRLQSGGGNITPVEGEPSAAGTLRLMTAQHNAALNQTGARPQELLAIQQRRTLGNITNATGDLARAAPPTPVPTGAQPTESNKQQFSPGRVLAPPQHRHGPFYGHNPNLKLPPELFLLGCIFVVVEVERYLEETSPDWRTVIERHGGEIEPVYCSRVTHVLCETQRHGVVMQALRDFKRCVTLFWLDDVVKRKQVLPPWQALHLPTGYIDGAPASRHLISLSGFTGMERSKVRDMIKYTGAKFTSYFSRHNTVLVCAKAEGVKYQHAKKWNTPIVNVQWLTDLMLGNFAALGQIEHVKYQQFTQPVQFSFDTAIVPNLMFAWKMPINISQESYERVKRSPAPITMPTKAKKPRLDPQPMEVEENQGTELQPSQSHRVLFSMVNDTQKKTLSKIVTQLGGSLAKSYQDATHLVMPTLGRSIKLLYCIAAGIHIVPDKWLVDSQLENKFLDETNFQFDANEFNKTYACDFYQTLAVQNRDKLFANKAFFITPSVVPDRVLLKELIELSGGVVEKQRRTLQQIEAANQTVPCSYIILTHSDDLHLVYDCLKNIKGNRLKCVSTCEFILSAILSQQLGIEKYLVKVELNG